MPFNHKSKSVGLTSSRNIFVCFESNRAELVWDKNGIQVTSLPPGDENGVIELSVHSGVRGQITLIVENKGTEKITLKNITLLWSVNFFNYSDISHIGLDKGNLPPGNSLINLFAAFSCPTWERSCLVSAPFCGPRFSKYWGVLGRVLFRMIPRSFLVVF